MVVAMAQDLRVLLVKLCDRLDNMRTLEHMSPEAQERIARETLEIYAPLAGRLGMQRIKSELEDLSFRYIERRGPRHAVEQARQDQEGSRALHRERLSHDASRAWRSKGFAAEVTGRAKHLYSIYRKMKEQQLRVRAGATTSWPSAICVESVADCYAALGVMHSQLDPDPGPLQGLHRAARSPTCTSRCTPR